MAFKIFNTLSRQQEVFTPTRPPTVGMYTCGPTVYNYAHIGNFRAYVFEDLLRRYLGYLGYQPRQVMNLTDVDDKTIRGAQAAGLPLDEYTRKFKDAFFADLQTLNIARAEFYPAATEHIPEMIALIETLLDKGFAYHSADHSIYFEINRFPAYGRLAHLDMAGLKPGARIAQDEYQKENAADFALWKAWTPEDGEVFWDSPWGRGRPGWHLECSAMSMKYLGAGFDLHTGGMDNIFPHHEDEIAQSEAATGVPFVTYWMHCAHLVVDGRKMSKSLGNFYTLRDLLERGYSGREIRYVLASAHYRQTLNFNLASLDAARAALRRADEFRERLAAQAAAPGKTPAWLEEARMSFRRAMDDDLNTSMALAALFDLIHEGNRRLDAGELPAPEAAATLTILDDIDRVFGFLAPAPETAPEDLVQMAEERRRARAARNWAEADRLRDMIAARGWTIQDAADGFKLKRNAP
ncbi:MAG: cysteine--tRNA ligase [Kiritimatiellia bacterium]|nr:cysteine--tRNA ligase [Lentisphaerota bacterium]